MAKSEAFDVAIIGGAVAGASAATLLLRERPDLRVLVVERSDRFARRIGEATVEVSAYFLGRVLGLTRYLNETQLVKNGMRFWFSNAATESIVESSELGGRFQTRLPSYQVDRSTLDEEILALAQSAGATLWRPAQVLSVALVPGDLQTVSIRRNDADLAVTARWVIDASGVAAFLARKNAWLQSNPDHPTTSAWARWRGVKDLDGTDLASRHPEWAAASLGIRGTATNHVVGDGWWSWWIPLRGGDTSVGVVFDQRIVQWDHAGRPVADALKAFLLKHPVGRELLAGAEPVEGDSHWRKNLAYTVSPQAGDGFVLVGDAAGFSDPLYSPGMDWLSYTVWSATRMILAERSGEPAGPLADRHNRKFERSANRWFQAIYEGKYDYIGEFDLMRAAFLLDLGFYYMGIVSQPFKLGARAFADPPFSPPVSTPFFWFIRLYNRRLATIGRARRKRGALGRSNAGRRALFPGFIPDPKQLPTVLANARHWAWLELKEGWRTRA